jgi:hypothetical protein
MNELWIITSSQVCSQVNGPLRLSKKEGKIYVPPDSSKDKSNHFHSWLK